MAAVEPDTPAGKQLAIRNNPSSNSSGHILTPETSQGFNSSSGSLASTLVPEVVAPPTPTESEIPTEAIEFPNTAEGRIEEIRLSLPEGEAGWYADTYIPTLQQAFPQATISAYVPSTLALADASSIPSHVRQIEFTMPAGEKPSEWIRDDVVVVRSGNAWRYVRSAIPPKDKDRSAFLQNDPELQILEGGYPRLYFEQGNMLVFPNDIFIGWDLVAKNQRKGFPGEGQSPANIERMFSEMFGRPCHALRLPEGQDKQAAFHLDLCLTPFGSYDIAIGNQEIFFDLIRNTSLRELEIWVLQKYENYLRAAQETPESGYLDTRLMLGQLNQLILLEHLDIDDIEPERWSLDWQEGNYVAPGHFREKKESCRDFILASNERISAELASYGDQLNRLGYRTDTTLPLLALMVRHSRALVTPNNALLELTPTSRRAVVPATGLASVDDYILSQFRARDIDPFPIIFPDSMIARQGQVHCSTLESRRGL